MKEVALGIDIGGTFTKFGFIERSGEAIYDSSVTTSGHKDIASYQKLMLEKVSDIKQVDNMQSMVVLSTFKDSKVIPVM